MVSLQQFPVCDTYQNLFMTEDEVIIVDKLSDNEYHHVVSEAVRYAIISLPFTVDRMKIPDEKQRALNIAKGKIAEFLFQLFCKKNSIPADFETCSTPFWTVDKRDFLLNGVEWDIKNNFIYHLHPIYQNNYVDLPALIPNRFDGDQWSKRSEKNINEKGEVGFLFTFLKNADLIVGKRGKEFLGINMNEAQIDILRKLYAKYKGNPQLAEPFSEDRFWQKMESLSDEPIFQLHAKPHLIITGYADQKQWHLFQNTGKYSSENNFQHYIKPFWYEKNRYGTCNFLNNTLWTKITNATLPISLLPSFLSLISKKYPL